MAWNVRSLMYQDASNSLYDCGHFDDTLGRYVYLTDSADSPDGVFLEVESPMQVGNTTSAVVFYDDGSWEDCTQSVQAIENVSTTLGLYESYKSFESCSYSDGTMLTNTMWTVPSIFNIKESGVADGLSVEIDVKSYSFN